MPCSIDAAAPRLRVTVQIRIKSDGLLLVEPGFAARNRTLSTGDDLNQAAPINTLRSVVSPELRGGDDGVFTRQRQQILVSGDEVVRSSRQQGRQHRLISGIA